MDLATLWTVGLSLISGLLAWNWKILVQKVEDVEKRNTETIATAVNSLTRSIELATASHERMQETVTNIQINYVQKDELRTIKKELLDRFDRLEDLVTKQRDL